ncbi:L,D-transpeptidase family protein [Streptomyces sp. NBC_01304]|uniref:L,D-transpeptidase family protein n=1 Tax=Streptomyces sp. NBC_01304 TaxID=2903818 RepID=UPI002E12BE4B|nr:L,D-transpeptidase family protein [Streptomyces sp. NBC_01304]
MRIWGRAHTARTALAAAACLTLLTSCGSSADGSSSSGPGSDNKKAAGNAAPPTTDLKRIPEVGDRLQRQIPDNARQVVAVQGAGKDSADATVALYTKDGATWDRTRSWPAHNGKKGWTTDHREGDKRSPVGVFTLSDAGGVLADPGAKLPYTQSSAFQASRSWPKSHWHDFDLVVAIDYNRAKGTSPNDPTRPQGQSKGGYIWLHMDHGSGTSGCVSVSKQAMTYLLRTLDPKQHPVIVMGDKANLGA